MIKRYSHVGVLTALLASSLYAQPVQAAATAGCALDIAPTITSLLGQSFNLKATINNPGADPGFAPMIEIVLPEELTYNSASEDLTGGAISPTDNTVITDNDGGDPLTGTVANSVSRQTVTLGVGKRFLSYRLPVGSFAPGQNAVSLTASVTLPSDVDIGGPLAENIEVQCVFALGEDALNNPSIDAPVESGFVTAQVQPSLWTISKTASGGPVSGPNYPYTFTVNADIANTATMTGIVLTDTISDKLYLDRVSAIVDDGNGFLITWTPADGSPVQTGSTIPFIPTNGSGGTLQVEFNQIDGTTSTADGSFTYNTYVPEHDRLGADILNETTGAQISIGNTVNGSGTYSGSTLMASDNANIDVQSIAITKSNPAIATDTGPAGFSPGDTVRYTVTAQISDYFSFDELVIEDLLPDGLTYVGASAELSTTEDGTTTSSISFVEATQAEANAVTGPAPYDFSGGACGGTCELAISADILDDNDATDPPGDGESVLTMDISSAIDGEVGLDDTLIGGMIGGAAVGQPTSFTLTYEVTIDESFIDTQVNDKSIDALDSFTNDADVSGAIASGGAPGTYVTDTDSSSFSIAGVSHSKGVAAFTDAGSTPTTTIPSPLQISAGDTVTFSLQTTIPTGDLDDLVFVDFLPLPIFDADELSTVFDPTIYTPTTGNPASIPSAGTVAFGNNTTGFTGLPPNPTITIDSSSNKLTVDFPDNTGFDETPSNGSVVQILFTLTVTSEPFEDGLDLVNLANFTAGTSTTSTAQTASNTVDVETSSPEIEVYKGAVAVELVNTAAVFDPATVGPTAFAVPGSNPSFTAPFSSTELNTNPIEGDISDIDAGDRITFAIALDNLGSGEAHEIILTDQLPSGFTTPPSSADLNLRVYDANGNNLASTSSGGLFGQPVVGGSGSGSNTKLYLTSGYTLSGSTLGRNGNGDPSEGDNILVVTYDLVANDDVEPLVTFSNTGQLLQYRSVAGGPNFVADATLYTQEAEVNVADVDVTKSVIEAPVGGLARTIPDNATFGEIVRYKLEITTPEGTISALELDDALPNRIGFDQDTGLIVDTSAACTGTPFNGTVGAPTVNSPVGSGFAAFGTDINATFGTITTTSDNVTTNNTFCVYYDAVLINKNGGNNQNNTATLTYSGSTVMDTARVRVVRPNLSISKTVSPAADMDAGDTLTYTLTVSHSSSTSDAYDIEITDTIPSGLTLNTSFDSDGLDNDGDGVTDEVGEGTVGDGIWDGSTLTWNSGSTLNTNFAQLWTSSGITLQFEVTVDNDVFPGETINNTANIEWDNLPTQGNANEFSNSTMGSRGITIDTLDVNKSVFATNIDHTTSTSLNAALQDLAIGEQVRYRIAVDVPESEMTNFVITDTMPDVLRVISGALLQDNGITHSFAAPTLSDNNNGDGINDTITFDFGTVQNAPDGDTETIIVEITADVPDVAGNSASTNLLNSASVDYTENPGAALTDSVGIDIVEPSIMFSKSVNPISADAGDDVTFTLTATNNGSAAAFDLEILDDVPTALTVNTAFTTDGLDNDGDGVTDEIGEGVGLLAGNRFTWNNGTTGVTDFLSLGTGETLTLEYEATLNVSVGPGGLVTNSGSLNYDSAENSPSIERAYSGTGAASVTVPNSASFTKTIRNNDALATIGSTVQYRLSLAIPEGTTTALSLTDTLPAGMAYIPGTTVISTNNPGDVNIPTPPTSPTQLPNSTAVGAGTTQKLVFDFGTVTNSNVDNGATEEIYVDFDAAVLNTSDNANGDIQVNTATGSLNALSVGPANAPGITIYEPELSIAKSSSYVSGDSIVYTMTIANIATSASGTAFDVSIEDTIPAGLTYSGSVVSVNGPAPGVSVASNTVTFTFASINTTFNAGNPVVFTYAVNIDTNTTSGTVLANTATGSYTNVSGDPALVLAGNTLSDERTGDTTDNGGVENDYLTGATLPLTITRPDLTTSSKTVNDLNGGSLEANDILEYTITVANTGNLDGTGIRVTDDIPANVNSLNVLRFPGEAMNNSMGVGSGANMTGFLDISGITAESGSSAVIVYQVMVDTNIGTGASIVNSMTVTSATQGGRGGSDTESLGAAFPELLVSKTADVTQAQAGETITYTVMVTNTGSVASTNTTLEDVIPSKVTYKPGSIATGTGLTLTDANDADGADYNETATGAVTVVFPSIPSGGSGTITYQVTVDTVSSNNTMFNTVTVTDDQGSNESATDSVRLFVLSTGGGGGGNGGGGGGGGGGGSARNSPSNFETPPTRDEWEAMAEEAKKAEEDKKKEKDPEKIETCTDTGNMNTLFGDKNGNVRTQTTCNTNGSITDASSSCSEPAQTAQSCFALNTSRNLWFSDLHKVRNTENIQFINFFKDTQIVEGGDFIFSGHGNHSTGKQQQKFKSGEWEFQPERGMTRLEVVKTVLIANCIPVEDSIPIPANGFRFTDLPADITPSNELDYFVARVFYTAYKHGIVTGYASGEADPHVFVSNAEAITLAIRAAEAIPAGYRVDKGEWYSPFLRFAIDNGIYNGGIPDSAGAFVTREDFARILARSMAYNTDVRIHGYVERVNFTAMTFEEDKTIYTPMPDLSGFENQPLACTKKPEPAPQPVPQEQNDPDETAIEPKNKRQIREEIFGEDYNS